MAYTARAKRIMNATSSPERLLLLAEISHPDLATPLRVINDTRDLVHNGNTYTATSFSVKLPDDLSEGQPRTRFSITNIGRELVSWLEASGGGAGASVRLVVVVRAEPDVAQLDITMTLHNVVVTSTVVAGVLAFDDLVNTPAVSFNYRPETAPGLF